MQNMHISRRKLLVTGASALAGTWLTGCSKPLPSSVLSVLGAGDALTYAAPRAMLPPGLVREFSRDKISPMPPNGTTNPQDDEYQELLGDNFEDWRLPIDGFVMQPISVSLDDLGSLPSRTQITQHTCEEGWSAIAEWTGVQLSRVLAAAGLRPEARYLVFATCEGWWDSIDMLDALHPQTILAYGM